MKTSRSNSRPIGLSKRFIEDRQANTGEDPKKKYVEFMKNDIIKPLNKKILSKEENKKLENYNPNCWALNTAKICPSHDKLPKLQQYKEYNFVKVDPKDVEKYKKTYFKTDHISVKVPNYDVKDLSSTFVEKKSKNLINHNLIIFHLINLLLILLQYIYLIKI